LEIIPQFFDLDFSATTRTRKIRFAVTGFQVSAISLLQRLAAVKTHPDIVELISKLKVIMRAQVRGQINILI
jgi:hypothetical protein